MATFTLIPGSMHGAWCWRDLTPLLEARGHHVVTPDLPCEDASAGLAEYAACVEAALATAHPPNDPLVLVGHSLGSRTVPIVAREHPGATMVFLCSAPTALGPVDPADFEGMVTPEFIAAERLTRADGSTRLTDADAISVFYQDCAPDLAQWAASQLRFQGPRPLTEPAPLEHWPDGRIEMIVCTEDRAARPAWLLDQAKGWLEGRPARLLPGGHSPMLAQPADLAALLEDLL